MRSKVTSSRISDRTLIQKAGPKLAVQDKHAAALACGRGWVTKQLFSLRQNVTFSVEHSRMSATLCGAFQAHGNPGADSNAPYSSHWAGSAVSLKLSSR